MKTLLISALLLSAPAFAAVTPKTPSLYVFSVDNRPADGNFQRVSIIKDEYGNYFVKHRVITAGFGFPVSNTVEVIGQDLICEETIANRKLESLLCAVDLRPADGALTELTLTRNDSGTYDATLRVATYGNLIAPPSDETKDLAYGLTFKVRK